MKLNRNGVTRLVIELDTVVIKIPNFTCQWDHFLQGLIANIHEGKRWRNAPYHHSGDVRHLLCPVIWTSWGGWISIMQKASICSNDAKLDYTPWVNISVWDHKPSNFGYLDGKLVSIDYQ